VLAQGMVVEQKQTETPFMDLVSLTQLLDAGDNNGEGKQATCKKVTGENSPRQLAHTRGRDRVAGRSLQLFHDPICIRCGCEDRSKRPAEVWLQIFTMKIEGLQGRLLPFRTNLRPRFHTTAIFRLALQNSNAAGRRSMT
jgi:hypothetical protein